MSRWKIRSLVAFATLAIAAVAASTALAAGGGAAAQASGPGGPGGPSARPVPTPGQPLSAQEAAGLTFMREEEKLARDVYTVLGDKYGTPVFKNIARSESRHMAAIKRLLDAYSVPDPASPDVPGSFKDPALASLYTTLVAQGQGSLAQALQAGVTIEKKDIADLEARVAVTDHADLKAVYGNLLRASQNHLRAFERLLAAL